MRSIDYLWYFVGAGIAGAFAVTDIQNEEFLSEISAVQGALSAASVDIENTTFYVSVESSCAEFLSELMTEAVPEPSVERFCISLITQDNHEIEHSENCDGFVASIRDFSVDGLGQDSRSLLVSRAISDFCNEVSFRRALQSTLQQILDTLTVSVVDASFGYGYFLIIAVLLALKMTKVTFDLRDGAGKITYRVD